MEFANEWLWLIFLAVGLVFVIMELMMGVDTGLDLVILGSVFVIGGLITWPTGSWIITAVVISVLSVAYLVLGRRYVHRRMLVKEEKTNVDTLIGKSGVVLQPITEYSQGLVKVGYEEWRARAEEEIPVGTDIIVTEISGVTLTVKKRIEGEN